MVSENFSNYEPILKWNKLPFFPEYTDHGETHLAEVLTTADALIPTKSFPFVTAADIAALSLSVLLHDLGMHLNEAGFLTLLGQKSPTLPKIDKASWSQLWQEFLADARRWDGKKLTSIFGSPRPPRVPPVDPDLMLTQDRLLIGEFIRRHHPRLAHEIAIKGFPGSNYLKFSGGEEPIGDLGGWPSL